MVDNILNIVPENPIAALVAGDNGLADLRVIIADAPRYLQPGGYLLVEHGFEQAVAVQQLFEAAGFTAIETRQDLGGMDRVTGGRWHAE